MFDEAMQALAEQTMKGSETFLTLGACMQPCDHKAFDMIYRLELANASYDKILVGTSGNFWLHNAPVSVLLGTTAFKLWEIRDDAGKQVFIAHDRDATTENKWWSDIRAVLQNIPALPVLYGDLVVFRYQRPIAWTMKQLKREMLSFVVQRYGNNNPQYKFSE
jgi:hypothetical protein